MAFFHYAKLPQASLVSIEKLYQQGALDDLEEFHAEAWNKPQTTRRQLRQQFQLLRQRLQLQQQLHDLQRLKKSRLDR